MKGTTSRIARRVGASRWAAGLGLVAVALLAASCASTGGGHEASWDYSDGPRGPAHWATLSPDYRACAGRNQSPLVIVDAVDAELAPIGVRYEGSTTRIEHKGHEIEVYAGPGSWLEAEGKRFDLERFHFHVPAENRLPDLIDTPIEAHFVHHSADGETAVLAVIFRAGGENGGIAAIQSKMPARGARPVPFAVPVESLGLVPADRAAYWRYNGSLTTPPCTEGLRWFVLQTPATASATQALTFERATGKNARPTQRLWARLILQ